MSDKGQTKRKDVKDAVELKQMMMAQSQSMGMTSMNNPYMQPPQHASGYRVPSPTTSGKHCCCTILIHCCLFVLESIFS